MPTPIRTSDYQPLVNCGIALNDALQAIDHHHLPTEPDSLGSMASGIQEKVDLLDAATKHCDVACADAMWLLGHIFNMLYPIQPGRKGTLAHGEWGRWCEKHGFKRQYAQEARHYAERFTRHDARSLGWRGMRSALKAEQDVERQAANGGAEGSDETNGGSDKEGKGKRGKKATKEWHVTVDLERQLNDALSPLLSVVKRLTKAKDLTDNLNKTKAILTSQRHTLKQVSNALDAVYEELAKVDELIAAEEKKRNVEVKERTKRIKRPTKRKSTNILTA